MEINLEEVVISQVKTQMIKLHTMNQRKRQYGHKKKDSEIQALVVKSQAEIEAETTASDLIKKL